MRSLRALVAALALPCAVAAALAKPAGGPLVLGGFRASAAQDGAAALGVRNASGRQLRLAPLMGEPPPSPRAVGDRLVLSLDGDMASPVRDHESLAFAPAVGAAGPNDWVVARFPERALVVAPPFRVHDVLLGLDDLHGAVTWPAVEVWVEDGARPLQPRSGSASVSVAPFDAVQAGLPRAPAGASEPTAFRRLRAGIPALDVPPAWLSDGAFDDGFAGGDAPLDDPTSDWIECEGAACSGSVPALALQVLSGRVVRGAPTASTLAAKLPAYAVDSVRPARDLDVDARVSLDLSAGGATRAGLALRVLASDAFYRVEYVKASGTVEVTAVTPSGPVAVGSPLSAGAPTDHPTLDVQVTGVNPAVTFAVTVDGTAIGSVMDSTWRLAGLLAGLSASDASSSGEAWDDFVVERRPDVFVALHYPSGGQAAIPLDTRPATLVDGTFVGGAVSPLLVSTDGAVFSPRAGTAGCPNPGVPFVQVEVEDTTGSALFQDEAHVVSVDVACATCPTARESCGEVARADRHVPVPTAGESHDIVASWWNEHLSDGDRLLLRATVYDAPCASATGSVVATGALVVGADSGETTAGGAVLRRAQVGSFIPALAGDYCVVLEELHDTNGDCCPDGAEGTSPFPGGGCPASCTTTTPSDSNPTTGVVVRDLHVVAPCTPVSGAQVNLDCASLRVTRDPGELVVTHLSWGLLDASIPPAQYVIYSLTARRFDPSVDPFTDLAPVLDRPVGALTRSYDLPAPAGGLPLWMAVYQADGCTSGNPLVEPAPCP